MSYRMAAAASMSKIHLTVSSTLHARSSLTRRCTFDTFSNPKAKNPVHLRLLSCCQRGWLSEGIVTIHLKLVLIILLSGILPNLLFYSPFFSISRKVKFVPTSACLALSGFCVKISPTIILPHLFLLCFPKTALYYRLIYL